MASVLPEEPAPIGHNNPPAEVLLESMVSDWYALKAQIADLTAKESDLRKAIFARAFTDAPEKGSVRAGLGYGKDLKATTKLNYSIDKEALAQVRKADAIPPDVLDLVVRYKPEVVEAEFLRIANPEHKRALASFITSKPGLPSLEIVDAKKRG
jgi:hypothetical protein